jgi:hypothetical protein
MHRREFASPEVQWLQHATMSMSVVLLSKITEKGRKKHAQFHAFSVTV